MQIKYFVNRDDILILLESAKIYENFWGCPYLTIKKIFENEKEKIEYNRFVTILTACYTSKMHGNANKGLTRIRQWAAENKK
jgi:hypothetical protein